MRAAFALAALALLWAPAYAEMAPRAEDGEVRYLLLGEPEGLHSVIEVGRDEVAWTETLRPTQLVRLTASGIDRVRPGRAPGLQAGALRVCFDSAVPGTPCRGR